MGSVNRQAGGGLFGGTEILQYFHDADPTGDRAVGMIIPCKQLEILELGFGVSTANGAPSISLRRVTAGSLMDPAATVTVIDSVAIPATAKSNIKKLSTTIAGVDVTSLLDANSPYKGIGVALQLAYVRNGSTLAQCTGWVRYRPIELPLGYV